MGITKSLHEPMGPDAKIPVMDGRESTRPMGTTKSIHDKTTKSVHEEDDQFKSASHPTPLPKGGAASLRA